MSATKLSVRALKDELTRRGIDFSGCNERSELEQLLQHVQPPSESPPSTSSTPAEALSELDLEAELAKISNLLDTLPASMQLLEKKWTGTRQEKISSQLKTVKEILGRTSAQASTLPGWQNRLSEFNTLAREFKRIRDMPRNMEG